MRSLCDTYRVLFGGESIIAGTSNEVSISPNV